MAQCVPAGRVKSKSISAPAQLVASSNCGKPPRNHSAFHNSDGTSSRCRPASSIKEIHPASVSLLCYLKSRLAEPGSRYKPVQPTHLSCTCCLRAWSIKPRSGSNRMGRRCMSSSTINWLWRARKYYSTLASLLRSSGDSKSRCTPPNCDSSQASAVLPTWLGPSSTTASESSSACRVCGVMFLLKLVVITEPKYYFCWVILLAYDVRKAARQHRRPLHTAAPPIAALRRSRL